MFCSLFMQLSGRKMPQLYFFQDEWRGGGGGGVEKSLSEMLPTHPLQGI